MDQRLQIFFHARRLLQRGLRRIPILDDSAPMTGFGGKFAILPVQRRIHGRRLSQQNVQSRKRALKLRHRRAHSIQATGGVQTCRYLFGASQARRQLAVAHGLPFGIPCPKRASGRRLELRRQRCDRLFAFGAARGGLFDGIARIAGMLQGGEFLIEALFQSQFTGNKLFRLAQTIGHLGLGF